MTVLPLPVALWMALDGNVVSALGLFSFGAVAFVRLTSAGVRRWTDKHQWLFLGMLILILLPTILDAMP